ncbi:Cof-type HAD-IIB family hydrolase [Suttonella ornithocola]|uniref:Bifunctional phosphatase/peptidyl-prolyl cis-trans isomerase n=1 Tax=Suttonella ornithocola TaxID=279832 RepID=A0A380N003_9GAMM|nr:Cof-type HAD-IIB family hydrolase [Suttonella ornithocola]SUO97251.1 Putative bifunctional phosphatase/peptidyl-prolyl cis-trans isomerase [Suttonella ornithocola]
MQTKIIFFDIDDTLCRLGQLPKNNYQVLHDLRQVGIRLAIATGRSVPILPHDIRALFDEGLIEALVSANGQYNLLDDQIVSHYPLDADDAAALIALCREYDLGYQQLSEKYVAWSDERPESDKIRLAFPGCIVDPEHYRHHSIYQFSVFLPEQDENIEVLRAFEEMGFHLARWHKGGADVLPKNGSKARGITDVCLEMGIDIQETMAFGDGLNDLEMLQHVGIGVAMGDGWPQLKAVADYVTGTIEEDGIRQALQHFKILSKC